MAYEHTLVFELAELLLEKLRAKTYINKRI